MEYLPLNPDRNEIRILILLPGDESNIVCCSLEHVSLMNPPEYRALSYCWGDPEITTEVIINEMSVQVTTNLELALRHLRAKGYTCLWVDAICINQRDKTEKNQQLLWMGSIYRRAKEVEAWIGEEGDDSNEAFGCISANTADSAGSNGYGGILRFIARPYWKRVWVIQELALARHCTIHCGQRDISWQSVASITQSAKLSDSSPALANIRNLIQFHLDAARIKPLRLLEALSRSCSSVATDSRDKVFALLGLVYDSSLYIPVPNYKQSIKDLSISMALSVVSTTSSLDEIIFLGSGCGNTSGLPSWTPDWFGLNETSSKRQCAYIVHGVQPSSYLGYWPHGNTWYNASGDTKASCSMNSGVLRLRGRIFDEVDGICPTLLEVGNGFKFPAEWQPTSEKRGYRPEYKWEETARTMTRYSNYPEVLNKINHDFIDSHFGLCWDEKTIEKVRDSARPQTIAWILEVGSFVIEGQTLKELAMKHMAYNEWDSDHRSYKFLGGGINGVGKWKDMVRDMDAALDDNMRFMTTKNSYVGWAHPRSQKGDMICILEGCTVPAILRIRAGGGFVLVGDGYVHGMMEGQLFKKDRGKDWVEIEIH